MTDGVWVVRTASGPNFAGPCLDYQWLPRSEVAGRSCPAEQAGARPKSVIRELPSGDKRVGEG